MCMDIPQYVGADVSLDYPVQWKIYYTLHKYMEILLYVDADVSSEDLPEWMMYYIYHKLCTFSSVYIFKFH